VQDGDIYAGDYQQRAEYYLSGYLFVPPEKDPA
jgi:hypothetical protein